MDFFAECIFAAVLGLYMDEKAQSLLNSDEILICSSDTTSEEVYRITVVLFTKNTIRVLNTCMSR